MKESEAGIVEAKCRSLLGRRLCKIL